MAVFLLTDRGFERYRLLRDPHDLANLIDRHVQLQRYLVGCRLVAVRVQKLARYLLHFIDRFHHVHGNADGSCLVGNRTGDGLANPPRCIGRKFKTLGVIEFFDRLNEAEVSLLNQVEELHSAAKVTLGDADDQTKVRFGKALLCGFVSV